MVIGFRERYSLDESISNRVAVPQSNYYGTEVWEMAIAALLRGENILLSGPKATGKNVLAENLSYVFNRPSYNMSFHVNTDSSSLIGTDTFEDGMVKLRKGPVYLCALHGGFGIFDEINMAKNDAVSVLHSTLDFRRIIDIPGYEKIVLHEAARFIGTMNYGYVGTKELNEALVSRFLVVEMPAVTEETLIRIISEAFPDLTASALEQFCGLFLDLQLKANNGEITTKPVDLRGLMASIKTIQIGLMPASAIKMGITNKTFDSFERDIIDDAVLTRIPNDWKPGDVFRS
ncbi:MAG: MoxR family ATPase [Eubacteriaceae bacterium]|nr:MoxR family ATPase [Eubacteriaceae bacterium]